MVHVDVIDSADELAKLKENWDSVYFSDPESQLFLASTWIFNWFDRIDKLWMVLAAKATPDAADYVAFFPLQLDIEPANDGSLYNRIRMGAAGLPVYAGLICRPEFAEQAIPAFAAVMKSFNWMDLDLMSVVASDERLGLLTAQFQDPDFKTTRPSLVADSDGTDYSIYPCVELPDDWESYLQTKLGPTIRRNARANLRMLENGEYRITHADAESFERDLDVLLGLWTTKWAPIKGERQLQVERESHRVMLRACFADGLVFLPVLWKNDTPIGAQARLIDRKNRSLICLMASRDLTIKKPSPGFVLHLHNIRWAIENGFRTYDLMGGNHAYKYDFGPRERRLAGHAIMTADGRNLRGKLDPRCLDVVFSQSRQLAHQGNPEAAAMGCRNILHADPQHEQARRLLAELESKSDGAVPVQVAKAVAHLKRNEFAEAQAMLADIVQNHPTNYDAQHMLGVTLLMQRRFEDAKRHIEMAIKIDPNKSGAHYNLGRAFAAHGKHQKALASFHRAIKIDPGNVQAYTSRGTSLANLGHMSKAVADFDRAIDLNPNDSTAHELRNVVMQQLNGRA